MKRLLRILLPVAIAAASLIGGGLPGLHPAKADSVGLYVGSCVGGGYSYGGSPATIGTYEVNNNGTCLRVGQRSWYSFGTWYDYGQVQSGSNLAWANYAASAARGKHWMIQGFSGVGPGNTCSNGAGACGTW